MIPAALCGRHRKVLPKWRTLTRKAVKAGSWKQGLVGIDWIRLDEAPGKLVLMGPDPLCEGENVLLFEVYRALLDVCYKLHHPDSDKVYTAFRDLVLEGAAEFWFCLGILGAVCFPQCETYRREKAEVSRKVLSQLLAYWREFRELDSRFSWAGVPGIPHSRPYEDGDGWRMWARIVASYCRDMGVPEALLSPRLDERDQMAAGEIVHEWVREFG